MTVRRERARLQRSVYGAATLEFTLAATLVLVPVVMGIFELAQLVVARHGLGFAATEVARSIESGAPDSYNDQYLLRSRAALALVPMFPRFNFSNASDGGYASGAASLWPPEPYASALTEAMRTDLLDLQFTDISDSQMLDRYQSVRVQLTWCRDTIFPLTGALFARSLVMFARNSFEVACLARQRWPLRVSAVAVVAAFATAPTD